MSAGFPTVNFTPFGTLLEEKELTISDSVFITSAYNEISYFDRTLCLQKYIQEDNFFGKTVKGFLDLKAPTEQEFKQFCQLNPNSNTHWLEKDKSGKILLTAVAIKIRTLRNVF
jgi:hypothetical protein